MKPGVWRTKDGREIAIGDLTDEHLASIVRMLEDKHDLARADTLYFILHEAPCPATDGTLTALDWELRALDDVPLGSVGLVPSYRALKRELQRRNQ